MDQSRIPMKCYNFLKRLDDYGADGNWVSKIGEILNSHGFGFVRLNQGVENHKYFLSVFEQRCKDLYGHWSRLEIKHRLTRSPFLSKHQNWL